MTADPVVAILKRFGAENLKPYCLINNYGYTFDLKGVRYDARFWANMYGYHPNEWHVDPSFLALEQSLNAAQG